MSGGVTFLVDCEFCGKSERQAGEPINRDVMLPGQQTKNLTVCKDCAAKLDRLQKPAKDEQAKKDEEAAKAMAEKLKAEEAANKPADPNAILAQMMGMMMQQNQQILELLAANKPKAKKNATKAAD